MFGSYLKWIEKKSPNFPYLAWCEIKLFSKNFFFLISNKTFIEKIEHHVHDGEQFEQWNKYKKIKS